MNIFTSPHYTTRTHTQTCFPHEDLQNHIRSSQAHPYFFTEVTIRSIGHTCICMIFFYSNTQFSRIFKKTSRSHIKRDQIICWLVLTTLTRCVPRLRLQFLCKYKYRPYHWNSVRHHYKAFTCVCVHFIFNPVGIVRVLSTSFEHYRVKPWTGQCKYIINEERANICFCICIFSKHTTAYNSFTKFMLLVW